MDSSDSCSDDLQCVDEKISAILKKISKKKQTVPLKTEFRKIKEQQEDFAELLHSFFHDINEKITNVEMILHFLYEREKQREEEDKMKNLFNIID